MKTFLLSIFLLLGIFVVSSFAVPMPALPSGSIYDSFLHPNDNEFDQRDDDVIGDTRYFQIFGHRWSENNAKSRLEIFLTWNKPLNLNDMQLGARLGDVFLDDPTDGDHTPDKFVAVRDHSNYDPNPGSTPGQESIDQGNIYKADKLFRSNDYYGSNTSTYGDNEIVTGFGSRVEGQSAQVQWINDSAYAGGSGFNVIDILFSNNEFADWDIRFAFTCGNDVHSPSPTPEPATMLLFGTGLVGLAGFGRRKFKKQ